MKYGMFRLVFTSLILFTVLPLVYIFMYYGKENPNITILIIFFGLQFFAIGFLFGNLRALAMQPVGHIAGVGAAINGFVSTIMAVPIATCIGRFIDTTSLPLFVGFLICGIVSLFLLMIIRTKNSKLAKN